MSFDPYYTWLGIPPEEQPADHYRLLGIRRFESNLEVIENAADQRMVYIRTYQNGPRSADSQRLLNEISAARVCLLHPHRKAAYDQGLRGGGESRSILPAPPPPNSVARPPASSAENPAAPAPLPPSVPILVGDAKASSPHRKPLWKRPSIISAAATGVICLALLAAYLALGPDKAPVAHGERSDPAKVAANSQSSVVIDTKPNEPQASDAVKPSISVGEASNPNPTPQQETSTPSRPSQNQPPPSKVVLHRPPRASPLPAGAIDLLETFDAAHHVHRGKAEMREDGLYLLGEERVSLIYFPGSAPPDEYDLEMQATRVSGDESLIVGLVAGGQECRAVFDSPSKPDYRSGLAPIDRKWIHDTGYRGGRVGPPVFVNGREALVVIHVRSSNRVTCLIDGSPVFDFSGPLSRLQGNLFYPIPDKTALPRRVRELDVSDFPAGPATHLVARRFQ